MFYFSDGQYEDNIPYTSRSGRALVLPGQPPPRGVMKWKVKVMEWKVENVKLKLQRHLFLGRSDDGRSKV